MTTIAPELTTEQLLAHLDTNAYDGAVITTILGSLHCINTARPTEPERLQWYAKKLEGFATGASWDELSQAATDLCLWALGLPAQRKEVLYLGCGKCGACQKGGKA